MLQLKRRKTFPTTSSYRPVLKRMRVFVPPLLGFHAILREVGPNPLRVIARDHRKHIGVPLCCSCCMVRSTHRVATPKMASARSTWVVPKIGVPFWVPLNLRCRNIIYRQKGPENNPHVCEGHTMKLSLHWMRQIPRHSPPQSCR